MFMQCVGSIGHFYGIFEMRAHKKYYSKGVIFSRITWDNLHFILGSTVAYSNFTQRFKENPFHSTPLIGCNKTRTEY